VAARMLGVYLADRTLEILLAGLTSGDQRTRPRQRAVLDTYLAAADEPSWSSRSLTNVISYAAHLNPGTPVGWARREQAPSAAICRAPSPAPRPKQTPARGSPTKSQPALSPPAHDRRLAPPTRADTVQ